MVPLVKQLARVLPSDTTSYLTSEEVSTPAIPRRAHIGKAAVLKRLQAMQAEGLSNADMERRLNAEHVPTVTGQGRWHRRTIGKMLAQAEA